MKRLLLAVPLVLASFVMAPPVHADGAFHVECTRFPGAFPGATGGDIVITPDGMILANCRYPGPAEGGGVERVNSCVITPAGNFQCVRTQPQ